MVIVYSSYQLRQLMQHTSKSVMRVTKSVFCNLRQLGIFNARPTHRGARGGQRQWLRSKVMPPTSMNNTGLPTDYGQSCATQTWIPTVIGRRPPPTHHNSTVRSIPRSGASACQHKQFSAHGHGQITSELGVNKNNLVMIKCDHVHVQPAKKSLRVCCLNPRSIKNKALSLSDYIVAQDYDVVALRDMAGDFRRQEMHWRVGPFWVYHETCTPSRQQKWRWCGIAL